MALQTTWGRGAESHSVQLSALGKPLAWICTGGSSSLLSQGTDAGEGLGQEG